MYRDNDKASNNTNNRHICVKKNSFRNQLFYHGQRSGDGYITKYLKETNEEDKFCIVARALALFFVLPLLPMVVMVAWANGNTKCQISQKYPHNLEHATRIPCAMDTDSNSLMIIYFFVLFLFFSGACALHGPLLDPPLLL